MTRNISLFQNKFPGENLFFTSDTHFFHEGIIKFCSRPFKSVEEMNERVPEDGLRAGDWRFSVKERLQLTHRDVGNVYQTTPNSLALKSRFKVSWKGLPNVTPYGCIEIRNVFNDPSVKATWSTTSLSYADYSFGGYNDAYINRIRGSLGAEWKVSKQHALDFFLLTDYNYDKNIDTNASGTKLKSLTWDQGINVSLGVGYKFGF